MTVQRQFFAALLLSLMCANTIHAADHEHDAINALLMQERWSDAAIDLELFLSKTPDDAQAWFNLARARAHLQPSDGVLTALNRAIDQGWSSRRRLKQEPAFAALREHDDFIALYQRMTERQHAQAREALAKLQRKYGPGLTYEIDDEERWILATALSDQARVELRGRLHAQAAALRHLFVHPPDHYISIVIPARWANPRVTGHFYPPAFLDASTMGSSLRHEFTHALHFADQEAREQNHPIWLIEGLATWCEDTVVTAGVLTPTFSRRLAELKDAVAAGRMHPFAKLLALERRQFTSQHYAQAGALLLHLHQAGKLTRFYQTYVTAQADDPSGRRAYETTWEAPLADIEVTWKNWLLSQPAPFAQLDGVRPSLGCSFRQRPEGLEVDHLVESGPAAQAGIMRGDLVIAAGDERVIDEEDLIAPVFSRRIGDVLPLTVRRATGDHEHAVVIGQAAPTPMPPSAESKPAP